MPIKHRRRIFRPDSFRRPQRVLGPRVILIIVTFLLAAVGGGTLMSSPSALFGHRPTGDGLVEAPPDAVAVIDGATLKLAAQVVRLRGVTAPTRGRMCHGGDGHAFDCGAAAAQGLAALVRDRTVTCRLADRDEAGRPQASCTAGGTEVNRAIIAAGWARAEGNNADLKAAEASARAARVGLWAGATDGASF